MTQQEWSNEFARNVRIQLQRRHMKQNELAERSGISPVTMNRYMKGHRVPKGDVISRFTSVLECSASDLIPNDWDY